MELCLFDWNICLAYGVMFVWLEYLSSIWSYVCLTGIFVWHMELCLFDWNICLAYGVMFVWLEYLSSIWSNVCVQVKRSVTLTSFCQKNKDGRVILLYDNDEKIAAGAATTLVQRGYDNIFMLSGGKCLMFHRLDIVASSCCRIKSPLPFDRQHPSSGDFLKDKTKDYRNCSVPYCNCAPFKHTYMNSSYIWTRVCLVMFSMCVFVSFS